MFLSYMQKQIDKKARMGSCSTALNYQCALRRFRAYLDCGDIAVESISSTMMCDYQTWLLRLGVSINTVSFYMRQLRAVYNRMVDEGLATDRHPFAKVYTGIARTRKRAIGENDLRLIKNADIDDTGLCFVRDMFMLSLYLMGISFVDLAHLKKINLNGDYITYRRSKTGQSVSVRLNSKIRDMLARYPSDDSSPYLLPIIRHPGKEDDRQYRAALRLFNMKLKLVAIAAGVPSAISTYTARHSWASLARSKDIQLSVISNALGHDNESTTRIYLSSIDIGLVGLANDLVLDNI